MDAIEFYTALVDHVRTVARRLECGDGALQGLLQGTLTTQIVCCENPAHVSEHEEVFYSLNVDVKGRRSLRESLAELTRGETLRGEDQYFCSHCGKKVDALKRYFFKAMPRTLVVHLKRFEFHIGRLKVIKLNDGYEFPLELDLAPFAEGASPRTGAAPGAALGKAADASKPSQPTPVKPRARSINDDSARYRLSGIIVHNGTTDEGHYYSIRRVPSPSLASSSSLSSSTTSMSMSSSSSSSSPLSSSSLEGEKKRDAGKEKEEEVWLELNDATVTPFDPREIPERCFGGPDLARNGLKAYSAYILFYDKVENGSTTTTTTTTDDGGNSSSSSVAGGSDSGVQHPDAGNLLQLSLPGVPSLEGRAASMPATPALSVTPPFPPSSSPSPPPYLPSPPSSSATTSPRGRASDILRRERVHAAKYRFLCGAQHMAFVWGLAHELPDRLQGFKLLLYVLVNIVARMSNRLSLFPRWFAAVKGFLCCPLAAAPPPPPAAASVPSSPPPSPSLTNSSIAAASSSSSQECARWLLRALVADKSLWRAMLHECPVPMVRLSFIDLAVTAFRLVSREEHALYGCAPAEVPSVAQPGDVWTSSAINGARGSPDGEDGSLAVLFIDTVLDSVNNHAFSRFLFLYICVIYF